MKKQKLPKQNETDIKRSIKQFLDFNGIWYWHILQGLGSYAGAPDLVACRLHEVWFLEVKTEKGKLSPAQIEFKERCQMLGLKYIVVRSVEDVAEAMGLGGL